MTRKITVQIVLEEHENESITIWFKDSQGNHISVKRVTSTWDASIEIGAFVLERAEE